MIVKIKALFGLFLYMVPPLLIFHFISGWLYAYSNLQIVLRKYEPTILKIDKIEGGGNQSMDFTCAVGNIAGEERRLIINEPLSKINLTYLNVFYTKESENLILRKEGELILDKTPYKRKAILYFFSPVLLTIIWWVLIKYINKKN